jgi:hypothetical protein
MFQILLRAKPLSGGNPIDIGIMNDTGSNIMSLSQTDVNAMGITRNYPGWAGTAHITTVNGVIIRQRIYILIQLRKLSGGIASDWFRERATVSTQQLDYRLSGNNLRRRFYFTTAPGNRRLFISERKHGLIALLPAVPYYVVTMRQS